MGRSSKIPRADHVAVYGHVRMERAKCPNCKDIALIVDRQFACCGENYVRSPEAILYVTSCEYARRKPPGLEASAILLEYNDACAYCLQEFGSHVIVNNRHIRLRLSWDHFIPFSWTRDNSLENFLPSCHLCNHWKRARVYNDLTAARKDLRARWVKNTDGEYRAPNQG